MPYKIKLARDEEQAERWLEQVRAEGYVLIQRQSVSHTLQTVAGATSRSVLFLLAERSEESEAA